MAARLGTIAAAFHGTPAARMVLAGVQEEPAATRAGALFHQLQVGREQQIGRRARNGPEHPAKVLLTDHPTPGETFVCGCDLRMRQSLESGGIESGEITSWWWFVCQSRQEDTIERLAEGDRRGKRGGCIGRARRRPGEELLAFGFGQDLR